jgi:hypothetical protein
LLAFLEEDSVAAMFEEHAAMEGGGESDNVNGWQLRQKTA